MSEKDQKAYSKSQKKAQKDLERLSKLHPSYLDNPPNRKWRRHIEDLIKRSGFEDILKEQQDTWKKNRKIPVVKASPKDDDFCPECGTMFEGHEDVYEAGAITRIVTHVCPECGYVKEDTVGSIL